MPQAICDFAACAFGTILRIGVPVLILIALGWVLHRIMKDRNGEPK
jgi:hypothetical protein